MVPFRTKGLNHFPLWNKSVFGGAETVFIGVDIDQLNEMAPRGAISSSGHGAELAL